MGFDASGSTQRRRHRSADYSWDFGDGSTDGHRRNARRQPRLCRPRPLQRHADGHRRPRGHQHDQPAVIVDAAARIVHGSARRSWRPDRCAASTPAARPIPRARSPTTAGTSATAARSAARRHPNTRLRHRGTHRVTLTVTNGYGQTETLQQHDHVVDTAPTAAFTPPAAAQQPNVAGELRRERLDPPPAARSAPTAGTSATAARRTGAKPPPHLLEPRALHGHAQGHRRPRHDEHDRHAPVTVDAAPSASFSTSPNPATPGPAVSFDATRLQRLARDDHGLQLGLRRRLHGLWRHCHPRLPDSRPVHDHADGHQRRRADGDYQHTRSPSMPRRPRRSRCPRAQRGPAPQSAFNAGSSSDAVGTIVAYSWNFGDGATAGGPDREPRIRQPRQLHGRADGDQRRRAERDLDADASRSTPRPRLRSRWPRPPRIPALRVNFNAGGSSDPGGAIGDYNWNFGDGATAIGPVPATRMSGPAPTR